MQTKHYTPRIDTSQIIGAIGIITIISVVIIWAPAMDYIAQLEMFVDSGRCY